MNSLSLIRASLLGMATVGSLSFQAEGALPKIALQEVSSGFVSPLVLAPLPGKSHLLLADQMGVIYLLDAKTGSRQEKPFLDLRPKLVELRQGFDERGLLGMALHPEFQKNGRLFVYYSAPLRDGAPDKWNHTSHVSEFKVDVSSHPPQVNASTEQVLLQVDQPSFNHNGGRIAFGPDGMLYIALGDGGNGNDTGIGHAPEGNGQTLTTLLGKILRIDVNGKKPYGIPKDNPFVQRENGALPEIYAYGIRNPWGMSFDMAGSHELFAADVGQNRFEEINIIRKGGNYGWNLREGHNGFNPENPMKDPEKARKTGLRGEPLVEPILTYKNLKAHANDPDPIKGISVTGGVVYRGSSLPGLSGKYLFGDWSKNWGVPMGILFAATRPEGDGDWALEQLEIEGMPRNTLKGYVSAFGQDLDGEVYVLVNGRNSVTGETGKLYRIVPATGRS